VRGLVGELLLEVLDLLGGGVEAVDNPRQVADRHRPLGVVLGLGR